MIDVWSTARLGDCCEIVSGATPSTSTQSYWNGDICWATPKDLSNLCDAFIYDTPRKITQAGLSSCGASILPAGSVLFSSRAPIGHVAINAKPMATNQGFKSMMPKPDFLAAPYLYHWLRAHREFLEGLGNGATFKEVSKAVVSRIEIPLPPLSEQRRIAAILDQADALRTKRRAALAQLDEMAQALFASLSAQTDSSEWPLVSLADAFWFQEGPGIRKWQFRSSGVKLLNVGNIERSGSINLGKTDRFIDREEAFGKYRHFLADAGDLVIASSGISFDDDGMLRTRGAFLSTHHLPLCMNTSTIRFKKIQGISDLNYLALWLDNYEFREQITKLVTGSAQQNFGPSHLKALKMTLPPLAIQKEVSRKILQLRAVSCLALQALNTSKILFSSLQHLAFTGAL